MSELVLFDIPSKNRTCWSLNPWKSRLILNFKGLEYETQWVEYPDIAPTLKSLGILQSGSGEQTSEYTLPAMKIGDKYVMDSKKIAEELERCYPDKPLHLDSPLTAQVQKLVGQIFGPLRPVVIPLIPRNVLGEKSIPYFEETRAKAFGKPLSELAKEFEGADQPWEEAQPAIEKVAGLLKEHDGPFFLGNNVSYADFIFIGCLHFLKFARQDIFDRLVAHDSVLVAFYNACKPWLARDDH